MLLTSREVAELESLKRLRDRIVPVDVRARTVADAPLGPKAASHQISRCSYLPRSLIKKDARRLVADLGFL